MALSHQNSTTQNMASPELTVTYNNANRPPRPARPRITLPQINASSPTYSNTPTLLHVPMSAGTARPLTPAGGYPSSMIFPNTAYQNKASEFMFKRFEGFKDFTMNTAKSGLSVGEKFAFWSYGKLRAWSKNWFTHIFLFFVVFLYTILGAMVFVAIEAPMEKQQNRDIQQLRRELVRGMLKILKDPVNGDDERTWEGKGVFEMVSKYEPLIVAQYQKYGTPSNDTEANSNKRWGFWNAVFYCGTIYTTIGYGHISPSTTTGRAITIVYAIFGIPMFLILLADFGKLFTRGIKFLWAFVRRLYYTGSCRKVRRTGPVQDVMKGVQLVYNFATQRRPSQMSPDGGVVTTTDTVESQPHQDNLAPPSDMPTPGTPAPSNFEVDDEFNLPISVAIVVLLLYIFVGATMYYFWEEWGFFESFYFVFISMSTIGFGDFVPQHPMYMMASIIYLVFGLALTSMCINVVQEKLSASFQQASAKIGATIGLRMSEEEAAITPIPPPEIEMPEVHQPTVKKTKDS